MTELVTNTDTIETMRVYTAVNRILETLGPLESHSDESVQDIVSRVHDLARDMRESLCGIIRRAGYDPKAVDPGGDPDAL